MPPPGYEPFLRAICENPEDDPVRLVYADWLDENGDPDRAEFIRLQIDYARGAEWHARAGIIPRQCAQLWLRNRAAWHRELPQIRGVNWGRWDRGFRNQVGVNYGPVLMEHADEIFASAPIQVITAHLANDDFMEQLVTFPRLNQIRELGFVSCQFAGASWRRLAACRRLAGLRRLVLCLTGPLPPDEALRAWTGRVLLTEADATALAESPVFTNLETLIVRGFLDTPVAAILEQRFKNVEHGLRS